MARTNNNNLSALSCLENREPPLSSKALVVLETWRSFAEFQGECFVDYQGSLESQYFVDFGKGQGVVGGQMIAPWMIRQRRVIADVLEGWEHPSWVDEMRGEVKKYSHCRLANFAGYGSIQD